MSDWIYGNIGASRMYGDIMQREEWKRVEKSDHPAVSGRQCYFCKRGIQEGEGIVRDGENVAHEACVWFLVGLIDAAKPRAHVPEPNLEAVRQDVRESERRVEETRKALARANYIKNRLMYK